MSITANIVSAVLKSVVGDKLGSGLTKELTGITIDGVSKKGINELVDFINEEKYKIDSILSKENMRSMGISEDKTNYVVTEIKDLLSRTDITDEVLSKCRYDSKRLSDFLWNKYEECKNDYIECESEIKKCLFVVVEALIKIVRESENFEKKVLIQISNSIDDTNVGLKNILDYIRINFGKLDDNNQFVLNILMTILEHIQKDRESCLVPKIKFQNDKKQKYIENWNSRLFLHIDNDERPITLADAFIMPDYELYNRNERIGFSYNDPLDMIIEKFVKYDKTSTLVIAGVPGIGKSSITSWIADKYKENEKLIVLRFRDWEREDLENGLIKAICNTLGCKKKDLNNNVLVIDGFDEIKCLDKRENLLRVFLNDIKDFNNFKCIVTSRPAYINIYDFKNVLVVRVLDITRVEKFYEQIKGDKLHDKEKIKNNLEVLGIPVILYMAIMSDVDISKNPTKPEMYNRIFARKGGIFDKFSYAGTEYDIGNQILRDPKNVNKYLDFLRETAFKMFEKGNLILQEGEFIVPELVFQEKVINVLEFPLKQLFDKTTTSIEFIHKSIYDYFVAEYFFITINDVTDLSKGDFAGFLGYALKDNDLSNEILEFLEYKIRNEAKDKFNIVFETFYLMLQDGMTYYTKECYKNVIDCELKIFIHMLEIMHLWRECNIESNKRIQGYLNICNTYGFDLSRKNLSNMDLSSSNLYGSNLEQANLSNSNLSNSNLSNSNLREVNLKNAKLKRASLIGADLHGADLSGADLEEVDLRNSDITGTELKGTNLMNANLEEVNLYGAHLEGKNLKNANLRKVNLKRANLKEADLRKADLTGAQLQFAQLKFANLSKAMLKNASLIGADLRDANLIDTDLTDAVLDGSQWYVSDVKKIFAQLKLGKFSYIIVADCQKKKLYKNELFFNINSSNDNNSSFWG